MTHELAQAIRDLSRFGRLSEESEENISAILDEDTDEEDDKKKSEPPVKPGTSTTGKDK